MYARGLMDQETYDTIITRHVDPEDRPTPPLTGAEIRALREREHMSQADFAKRLSLTPGYISQLERGMKRPSGPALVLLSVIQRKGHGSHSVALRVPPCFRDHLCTTADNPDPRVEGGVGTVLPHSNPVAREWTTGAFSATASPRASLLAPRPDVRDVEQVHGPPAGDVAAAIVAGGGGDRGMAGELLDGADVRAGVEEIGDEAAAEVVGGE